MIAIGCDHGGFELKEEIVKHLKERGTEYKDFGIYENKSVDYPEIALKVSLAVQSGETERGILVCGTGIGMSLAANKVNGIRCATCSEPYSASLSRRHNDTNMLAFGSRVVGIELAKMIVYEWLTSEFEGGRHRKRVTMICEIEKKQVAKLATKGEKNEY